MMTSLAPIVFAGTLASALTSAPPPGEKPNVVLILADDLGYGDLSCYDQDRGVPTPHIDQIAAQGVRLTQFYAASNVCSPSRRALLTGRYQSRLGEWAEAYRSPEPDNVITGKDAPVFAQYLKKAGYATGSFGKWNIGNSVGVSTPEVQGFDYWIGCFQNISYFGHMNDHGQNDFWENGVAAPQYAGKWADDVFVDKAIEFIRKNKANPFFVYLPVCTPHTPFEDPQNPVEGDDMDWWNKPGGKRGNLPPKPADRPKLAKMVSHLDDRIGDLLNTLAELNLDKNTLVIFTSDNGGTPASINAPLRGFKQSMLEGGIRVPCLMKWPGVYPAGITSAQVGISMDLAQTIAVATGGEKFIPAGRELDGIDLTPILDSSQPEVPRLLAWRRREWAPGAKGYNHVWDEAYFSGDYKYIREFKETPGFAKAFRGTYPPVGYVELLFDLKNDISEMHDLAAENPAELTEMRSKYNTWKASVVNTQHPGYVIPFMDQYSQVNPAD